MNATQITDRKTFDGKTVQVWTDGAVTVGQLATYVRGCGLSKTDEGRALDVQAGLLLMGEACVYESAELPKAVKSARLAVRKFADATDRLTEFRRLMNPVVKSAKAHDRGCRCFKCVKSHIDGGCRSVHCHTCGF